MIMGKGIGIIAAETGSSIHAGLGGSCTRYDSNQSPLFLPFLRLDSHRDQSRSIEMQGSKDLLVKLIPQQSRYEANHSWRRIENVSCPLVPLLPFVVVSFEDCSVLGFE